MGGMGYVCGWVLVCGWVWGRSCPPPPSQFEDRSVLSPLRDEGQFYGLSHWPGRLEVARGWIIKALLGAF